MRENNSCFDEALSGLVQVGIVAAVSGRLARVKLPETGEISGWLTVLRSPPAVSVQGEHSHSAQAAPWMPQVNARVLVLYLPVDGGGGFVLGGL